MTRTTCAALAIACFAIGAAGCAREDVAAVERQVADTERAFARTMADRDHDAFSTFVSDEAVFLSPRGALRGKREVVDEWRRYFEGATAPFSWEPDTVVVLESAGLALSTGPVYDPEGRLVARFTSTWRREGSDEWRIVFDKGEKACDEPEGPPQGGPE